VGGVCLIGRKTGKEEGGSLLGVVPEEGKRKDEKGAMTGHGCIKFTILLVGQAKGGV